MKNQWFSGSPLPLNEWFGSNHWYQWFFNGFWSINHWSQWFFSLPTIGLDGFWCGNHCIGLKRWNGNEQSIAMVKVVYMFSAQSNISCMYTVKWRLTIFSGFLRRGNISEKQIYFLDVEWKSAIYLEEWGKTRSQIASFWFCFIHYQNTPEYSVPSIVLFYCTSMYY